MRFLILSFFVLAAMGTAQVASAQSCVGNNCTSIVLHAIDNAVPMCGTAMDCAGVRPTVDVTGITSLQVIMLVRNYDAITGVQCAFQWGSWAFTFGLWNCQPNQLAATTPAAPGGPMAGTIATAFDLITGGTLAPIGNMNFVGATATSGCLEIIESSFPFGTHVTNPAQDPAVTPINSANWGKVCAGAGGYDSCDAMVAVESSTWGQIKSQYR